MPVTNVEVELRQRVVEHGRVNLVIVVAVFITGDHSFGDFPNFPARDFCGLDRLMAREETLRPYYAGAFFECAAGVGEMMKGAQK